VQLQVKGKNVDVTDALFDHAERKLGKLARILPPWDDATQVELELSVERNPKIERPQIAEVTVRTKGPVLRVRESAEDMYQAIDQAAHKLERQASRYRDRRRRRRVVPEPETDGGGLPPVVTEPVGAPDAGPRLIKSKRFDLQAMSAEEAALQMDLLAHDFYVFRNETDGLVNVVYRRRDGDYGLIEPES
jgi:putative sigma-54 modulation protein